MLVVSSSPFPHILLVCTLFTADICHPLPFSLFSHNTLSTQNIFPLGFSLSTSLPQAIFPLLPFCSSCPLFATNTMYLFSPPLLPSLLSLLRYLLPSSPLPLPFLLPFLLLSSFPSPPSSSPPLSPLLIPSLLPLPFPSLPPPSPSSSSSSSPPLRPLPDPTHVLFTHRHLPSPPPPPPPPSCMHQFHHTNLIFSPSRPFYMQLSTTNICPPLTLHLTSIANILYPLPPLSPPSSLLHPPSPLHTFVFLSCHPSLILLTCTHPTTHLSSPLFPPPSPPSFSHACMHTHTHTHPPSRTNSLLIRVAGSWLNSCVLIGQ